MQPVQLMILLLWGGSFRANTQPVYKWERDHPGIIVTSKTKPPSGYNTKGIFEVFHKIPMLHTPRGYEVREGVSVRLNGPVYTGQLMVGLPMYYRWDNGPLQKQGEYYTSHVFINDREELRDVYSHVFSAETQQLNFPPIYTDTFALSYMVINGHEVGVTHDRVKRKLYVLNPKRRPCFLPVTKEQFIKLWIGKLGFDIEKERAHQKELKGFITENKDHAEAVKNLQEGIMLSGLWLDFLLEKKKAYEQKLKSLSDEDKKEQAFAASPKKLAVLQEKGKYVDKVTGYLTDELADGIDAESTRPLFIFHPDFFDPKLPKTAFQLIIIRDGFRQQWKESKLMPLVEQQLFPLIDFKQLASLMYRQKS